MNELERLLYNKLNDGIFINHFNAHVSTANHATSSLATVTSVSKHTFQFTKLPTSTNSATEVIEGSLDRTHWTSLTADSSVLGDRIVILNNKYRYIRVAFKGNNHTVTSAYLGGY